MSAMLELRALDAFYGMSQALHGITLTLGRGEAAAILGANGAGKTTLLRAISGMVRTQGEILLGGERIDGQKADKVAQLGVAHVPEGRGTFGRLSIEENLRVGGHGKPRAVMAAGIEQAFAYFPRLKERRHQQAGLLSGGEQQMLAISRALMMEPRLLLLDEPSFGLAPLVVNEIFDILRRIRDDSGLTVLLIEQSSQHALVFAEYAHVLESGRLMISGTASEIAGDDKIRTAYLGG